MIDMKQAVQIALEFCRSLYAPEKLTDFLLEEVELSDDEKFWLVTIGFDISQKETGQPAAIPPAGTPAKTPEQTRTCVPTVIPGCGRNGIPISSPCRIFARSSSRTISDS